MERRILVLGGTGLLGGPVARRLHADGFEEVGLSRIGYVSGSTVDEEVCRLEQETLPRGSTDHVGGDQVEWLGPRILAAPWWRVI